MDYYNFLCSLVEELNDKATYLDLWAMHPDEADKLYAQADLIWDRAGKAARYNA